MKTTRIANQAKLTILSVTLLIFLFANLSASAATPDTIPSDYVGTVRNIAIIKKPESNVTQTNKTIYVVSAVSIEGVNIALYEYVSESRAFCKIPGTDKVVPSHGIYTEPVDLNQGINYLGLYAKYSDASYQWVRFDITVLDQQAIENANEFSQKFEPVFSGWLN